MGILPVLSSNSTSKNLASFRNFAFFCVALFTLPALLALSKVEGSNNCRDYNRFPILRPEENDCGGLPRHRRLVLVRRPCFIA
jgi:hypothetical protein